MGGDAGQEPRRLPRRSLPGIAAVVGGAGFGMSLAGCGVVTPGERRTPRPPTADELALDRAVAEAVRLRVGALALAADEPSAAARLRGIAADHEAHLRALGVTASSPAPAVPGPSATPVGAGAVAQRDAEWAAARAALRDALDAGPGLAALLARIAASRAVHADTVAAGLTVPAPAARLDPAPPPPAAPAAGPAASPSPRPGGAPDGRLARPELDALTRLVTGHHAAVFAYPLVLARCAAARRPAAGQLWRAHIAERDELERTLIAGGGEPPAAAAAYDVGPVPADAPAAARLAANVETGLVRLAVPAVAATTGRARLLSARLLVTAARRAVVWGSSPGALPGGAA